MKTHQLGARIESELKDMKYMLLMNFPKEVFDWYAKWPKEDLKANIAFMRDFNQELKDSGVLVATEGLAFPDQAVIVRAGSDGAPITDGVFPESKEFLAGYWIVDVESAEEAYKIAARASAAPAPAGTPGDHARRGAASDGPRTGRMAVMEQLLEASIELTFYALIMMRSILSLAAAFTA
jgi:hypothetical protein